MRSRSKSSPLVMARLLVYSNLFQSVLLSVDIYIHIFWVIICGKVEIMFRYIWALNAIEVLLERKWKSRLYPILQWVFELWLFYIWDIFKHFEVNCQLLELGCDLFTFYDYFNKWNTKSWKFVMEEYSIEKTCYVIDYSTSNVIVISAIIFFIFFIC